APAAPAAPPAPATATSPPSPAAGAGGAAGAAGAPATGSAPAPVTVSDAATTLTYVPVAMTITGGFFEAERFLVALEEFERSFLVSGIEVRSATDALGVQELTVTVSGRVYTAPAPALPPVTVPPATAPAPPAGADGALAAPSSGVRSGAPTSIR
ncbi:MAG: hypothetical protein M3P91_10550, partial [Actinomycetota bacterium]|nr:hypothetical protein [Actinomycetota bacterium]